MSAQERPPQVPQPFDQEPQPYYAWRLLQHALSYGISDFGLEQAEQADRAAMQAVAALPAKLDADAARLDQVLHDTRHRLAAHIAQHRADRAQFARMLTELYGAPATLDETPGAPPAPESDADRATRLLRAALLLIMDPGKGNGGDGARLIRPKPTQPPSAGALTSPTMAPSGPRF